MSAYLIVDVDVHDPAGFVEYQEGVQVLIKKHGGEYLVRRGDFEVIAGDWQPHVLAIFQFPDRQAIRAFFDDPEYAYFHELRHRTSETRIIAVDGVD